MDAPSMTPERSRELADLRLRAYGPDADIHGDPDALRRLHELEEILRPAPAEAPSPDSAAGSGSAPAVADRGARTVDVAAQQAAPASLTAAPPGAPRSWWRRIPFWVSLAAVGVIGVLTGVAVSSAASPGADVTLHPAEDPRLDLGAEWLTGMLDWLAIDTPPTEYEPFHKLQVITATSEQGSTCLVVFWTNQWSNANCTPEGLTPIVDFVAYPNAPQPLDELLPLGTVIRFELRGDVVEVSVRRPEADQGSATQRQWLDGRSVADT